MPKNLHKDSLLTRLKRGVMQLGVEPVLSAMTCAFLVLMGGGHVFFM
jgi:hypothetical protein